MDIKVPDYCSECILWDYCDFSTKGIRGDACKQRIEQEMIAQRESFIAGIEKAASWEAIPIYGRRR